MTIVNLAWPPLRWQRQAGFCIIAVVNPVELHSLPFLPNTLGLPCEAMRVARLTTQEQLPALAQWLAESADIVVIGGASNVILPPRLETPVVLVQTRGLRLLESTEQDWIVEAQAGESWHGVVAQTLARGWPGLENLALIPGTVGAAPVQNIGAYGVEMAQRLHSVVAWHRTECVLHELPAAQCGFGYRDSLFKRTGQWLILAVRFRLPRRWAPVLDYPDLRRHPLLQDPAAVTPQAVCDAVCDIRRAKLPDPAELGNAGSFFKNPLVAPDVFRHLAGLHPGMPHYPQPDGRIKLAAGWLIERAGWKGRRLGPVGMHARQALVLVNHGGAVAADVLALEAAVRAEVLARFGVTLEREPALIA